MEEKNINETSKTKEENEEQAWMHKSTVCVFMFLSVPVFHKYSVCVFVCVPKVNF